jgi:hypothetical protein
MGRDALRVMLDTVAQRSPEWAAALAFHNAGALSYVSTGGEAKTRSFMEQLCSGRVFGASCIVGSNPRTLTFSAPDMVGPMLMVRGSLDGVVSVYEQETSLPGDELLGFNGFRKCDFSGTDLVPTLEFLQTDDVRDQCLAVWHLAWAAVSVGLAKGAFRAMTEYVEERRQFGKPLSAFQGIQWMIADSNAELDAADLLVASATEAGLERCVGAARLASRTAVSIADRAIQAHGGYGFTREYTPEHYWRSAHQVHKSVLMAPEWQAECIGRTIMEAR